MSKASVLQWVQDLSNNQADTASITRFYDDAVRDLARSPWLVNVSLVTTTAGVGEYAFPTAAMKLLQVGYDDRTLSRETLTTLEMASPGSQANWRDDVGPPQAWTVEDEPARTLILWPKPSQVGAAQIYANGAPFGKDYPTNSLMVFHTELRQDLPDWLDLPLALRVIHLEFTRESNHRDDAFGERAGRLADLFFQMVS